MTLTDFIKQARELDSREYCPYLVECLDALEKMDEALQLIDHMTISRWDAAVVRPFSDVVRETHKQVEEILGGEC